MTGFARVDGRTGDWSWAWEARSVNGKGLDVRLRMPPGFEAVEAPARQRAAHHLRRGNVTLNLTVNRVQGAVAWKVNRDALEHVLAFLPELRRRVPDAGPPSLEGILALRGVLETAEDAESTGPDEALLSALTGGLDQALTALAAMRASEGGRLAVLLAEQLDRIAALRDQAAGLAETQPAALRDRLLDQVRVLLESSPPLPEERIAQEVALLAVKADVREEIDRLGAHVEAARVLIAASEPVGRKFDFLCQEFNREANTLFSKSTLVPLTRVGLELKAAIEQMREQVQNVE
jgi:uncharacterized protein (TIGR00255 family)